MTTPYWNWNSPSYLPAGGGNTQPAVQSQGEQREKKPAVKATNATSSQQYAPGGFGFGGMSAMPGQYGYGPPSGGGFPNFGFGSFGNPPAMTGQYNYGPPGPGQGFNGFGSNGFTDPMRAPVNTTLIEVGYYNDGKADEHAQSVKQIYQRNNPQGAANVHYVGIGNTEADDNASDTPTKLGTKKELDEYIDTESTDAYDVMTEKINGIVKQGKSQVVNGSLGFSRDTIYQDVLLSLTDNPKLASNFGLKPNDISSLEKNKDGQVLVTDNVSNAVVKYVDSRLDQQNSAYRKSWGKYQQATKNAAQHGVTVVVAAGNDHELNDVFNSHKTGGDTNFLAQSDYVISVAAADDKGNRNPHDDQIASFSSWGDGRYNPTLAANGVGVNTKFGKQDGTSFSSPEVAATVARMKQVNPYLTFDQIKSILQQSATDIEPHNAISDGAGMLNADLAVQWARQFSQTA